MQVSVFTPTHKLDHLLQAYRSLQAQTYSNWKWIVVPNGEVTVERIRQELSDVWLDERVKIVTNLDGLKFPCVGALKSVACKAAKGDVLLELDHDDALMPTAIEKVAGAFEDDSVSFVYSNCANIDKDGQPYLFNRQNGWEYRTQTWDGLQVQECIAPAPVPQHLSRIWYAPDHVRAWRASFYHSIGGHNQDLQVGDDHELLCRTYLNGRMVHIDEMLYVHRMLSDSTW